MNGSIGLHLLPDFGDYYMQEKHSDVEILIEEESEAMGRKRRKEDDGEEAEGPVDTRKLFWHSMVLLAFSKYFKAKVWLIQAH
jgi:hypothetical protein